LGIINFKPVLEKVADAYGFPNPELLFNAPAPQQPPAAPNGGQQQQMPGAGQQQGPMSPGLQNALALMPQR
jgi:hypothetical protein